MGDRWIVKIDFEDILGRSDLHADTLAGDIMMLLHNKYHLTSYVNVEEVKS